MKASIQWRRHAHSLRQIAANIKDRPTSNSEDQIEKLEEMAEEIDADAQLYEELEGQTP